VRCARGRDRRRSRCRRDDREGKGLLRQCRPRRRRLVAPLCGNLGRDLPQLKILGSVVRTEKLGVGPECAASGSGFGYRKRLDGATTSRRSVVMFIHRAGQPAPPPRIPAIGKAQMERHRFRVGQRWVAEWQTALGAGVWTRPRPSNGCGCSIPNPPKGCSTRRRRASPPPIRRFATSPGRTLGGSDRRHSRRRAGDLAGRQPARLLHCHWLSGHGFGIGPGAGKLMAVVTGDPPVDTAAFRNSRLAAGDYPPAAALAT
jgi:hypothetical protein